MAGANKKYDVFISYRRTGGSAAARLVKAGLQKHGLEAFLDVDDLEAGQYEQALMERVAETPNFVVILSPHSLDSADERDVMRQEIARAVEARRKIVPLIMPGFQFPRPETLPAEFKDLHAHQGAEYSHYYFDSTLAKLVKYLRPAPRPSSLDAAWSYIRGGGAAASGWPPELCRSS